MLSRGKQLESWNISWRWRLMCLKINTATAICLICFLQLKEWELTVLSISTSQAIWRLYEITLSQSLIPNQAPLTANPSVSVTLLNVRVKGKVNGCRFGYRSSHIQGTEATVTAIPTHPSACAKSCWNQWKSTSTGSQQGTYFFGRSSSKLTRNGMFSKLVQ